MSVLRSSVGKNAVNTSDDVKIIQALLNSVRSIGNEIQVDGACGPTTISAIEAFQRSISPNTTPSGRIDPTGNTVEQLWKKASIKQSVGDGCPNRRADVYIIQTLLNGYQPAGKKLILDGRIGPNTLQAIKDFERYKMKRPHVEGRVDPHGKILDALSYRKPLPIEIEPGQILYPTAIKIAASRVESKTGKKQVKVNISLVAKPNELHLKLEVDGPSIGTQVVERLEKIEKLFSKLTHVKISGTVDHKGLKADWNYLWSVWFFELAPDELGEWSSDKTEVTIRSSQYTEDIKSRPQHKKAISAFKRQYPSIDHVKVGKILGASTNPGYLFQFVGEGTATGEYNAVEWFLGSYRTDMKVLSVDHGRKTVKVEVVVRNESHWESGTRLPQVAKDVGLPKYLVQDRPRSDFGPGGDFFQRFIWTEEIKY